MDRGLRKSLVFEDDLRFEIFFKRRLLNLMRDVERESLDWDLMWVWGRAGHGVWALGGTGVGPGLGGSVWGGVGLQSGAQKCGAEPGGLRVFAG